MIRRLTAAVPIAVVCGAVALLSSAFLYGTPLDEEEFRFAILSAWLRMRALAGGEFPYWSSLIGFGAPQPFVPNFGMHPLVPLLGVLSPVPWVRVVLVAHTISGAIGLWLLCRRLNLAPAVASVCVVTFLLAAPVQNYLLSDFWPSHFLVWTTVPWLLLLTWHILEDAPPRAWRAGLALGLLTGITIANTNPGHASVYAVLAVGILVARPRAIRRQWGPLALALLIASAIAAPNAVHLAQERSFFHHDLSLSNSPDPLPFRATLQALARPAGGTEQGTRTLFLGAPFAALSLLGCIWFARRRTDLVAAALVAAVMLFTTWLPASMVSARYQFRDPLTLCAILLAGAVADRWWGRSVLRPLAALALAAQTAVVAADAWPLIRRTWESEGRRAVAFRGACGDGPLSDRLLEAMRTPGRLLYSPRVDHAVAERGLVDDGLGLNAMAYRGAAVVNGSFKGVSTDTLWPNDRLFYGWIRTPPGLVASDSSLDVLGIRYVLAYRGEDVARSLREIWTGTTIRDAELVLYENIDANAGAFLLEPERLGRELPLLPNCSHDRLLCKDVGALNAAREAGAATVQRGVNDIRITWPTHSQQRVLVVTEMYRPEWTAASGQASLQVTPVYGGIMGISVPAGVSSVHLEYRPLGIITATTLCAATIVLALIVLAATRKPRRARRRQEADYSP